MVARPPRRSARGRLRADFSDAGVSEVLGNVILIAITVTLLGGFGTLVLTTVSNDTPTPPAASFTIEPAVGESALDVRLVSGSTIELSASTLRALVNGNDITESVEVEGAPTATQWRPGETLVVTLSAPLAADDAIIFIAADNASGGSIGTAYATVSGAIAASVLVENVLTPGLSFSPSSLVTDGATTVTATVDVGASMGLLLIDRVTVDLSPVGGPADLVLKDDGLGADDIAGDGQFKTSFAVDGYDYDMMPGVATVPLEAVVHDVAGRASTVTTSLTLNEPTPSKAGAGVVFRDIGSSAQIGTTGYIDLGQFVLREDGSLMDNDQVELRVSDLADPTKVWTALVSFAYDTLDCPGMAIVTEIELKVSGVPGSVVYTPSAGDCFEVTDTAVINLANVHDSTSTSAVTWDVTGTEALHTYEAAGISDENEALISFFGDTLSLSPSARGLDQSDFSWGPGTGGATAPSAITTLAAAPGDTLVDLSWSAPSDGGSTITEYNIYRDGALIATIPAPATSYQATGLTNGQSYTFRVRAVNAIGEAPTSNAASATPTAAATAPAAPTGLGATAGQMQVQLDWTAGSNGGSPITGYQIWRSTSSNGETQLASYVGTNTSYVDLNVLAGITYYYQVKAVNAIGASAASNEASATPTALPTAPAAPTDLAASAGVGQVWLTWTAPANGGSPITGYQIWRATSAGAETLLASYVGTNASYVDLNVAAGATYYYQVKAVNAIGTSAASSEASAAVPNVPGAPTGLGATAGVGQVSLSWTAPASDGGSGITGYQIWRATSAGAETLLASYVGTNTSYVDANVAAGTTYYYQIKAVNAVGASAASGEQSATPTASSGTASAPQALTLTPANQRVGLSWSAPASDGGSPITGYKLYRATTNSSAAMVLFDTIVGTNTSYVNMGLTNGTTYFYRILAVNANGDGTLTSIKDATPSGPLAINCASAVTGSGTYVSGSCTSMQSKDNIFAELQESQTGTSGNTKELRMTFALNVTGVTGTQSLQLVGRTGNSAENLLVQVLHPTNGYTTVLTLSSASTVTLSTSLDAATYWPSGTLTIRLQDAGPDGGFSSWHIDYFGLVTT